MYLKVMVAGLVFISACGGDDDAATTTSTTAASVVTSSTTSTSTTSTPATTTTTEAAADEDLPDEIEPTDYLTFANGVTIVAVEGLPEGSLGEAIKAIDGDPTGLTLTNSGISTDVTFVYELPEPTTFDRLAVPSVVERPGNVTFFRDVEVSGSSEGPDGGYVTLATATLEAPEDDTEVTELELADETAETPVRFVRLHLSGGLLIEEGEEDKTNLDFTEIIGNGTQDEPTLTDAFTGIWAYKPADAPQVSGELLELKQDGTNVTGCLGPVNITGTVNGSILRATGIDTRNEHESAYVLVPDAEGGLQGAASRNNGVFVAQIAPIAPAGSTTPCSDTAVEPPPVCDSIIYVNFDVDSAEIRPESDLVLDDLFDRLQASEETGVSLEGHTSTEGSDEYNQDLSTRRARAVVDALVARGQDESTISAVGKGESEPLVSPDADESARSLNRRVEILCS